MIIDFLSLSMILPLFNSFLCLSFSKMIIILRFLFRENSSSTNLIFHFMFTFFHNVNMFES